MLPLSVRSTGSVSYQLRHAYLQQEGLIHCVLGALEHVTLPATPRMLCAEGFQRMLEGQSRQREVRRFFEEAELECRKVLLGTPPYEAPAASVTVTSGSTPALCRAIQSDPYMRLLAYELRAACGHYANLLAVSSTPIASADALLHAALVADPRPDPVFASTVLAFEQLRREESTGARLETFPAESDAFIKESLLLERDLLGTFRFDPRSDIRHWLHTLKLSDLGKSWRSFAVIRDPVVQQWSNFTIEEEEVHKNRWMQFKVSCGPENHRIDPALPLMETVFVEDEIEPEKQLSILVRYDEPILSHRVAGTTKESRADTTHTEVLELAIEKRNRGFLERWFMDR